MVYLLSNYLDMMFIFAKGSLNFFHSFQNSSTFIRLNYDDVLNVRNSDVLCSLTLVQFIV